MVRTAATADLPAVRASLRSSSDPRVASTRARLAEAVRSLSDRGVEVSVRSLTAAAGVSRATFYTHFSGIDDLALHLQEEAFREIAATTRGDDPALVMDEMAMARTQRALIAHYASFRPLYSAALNVAVPRGSESRVAELMRVEILAHIRAIAGPPPGIDPEIAATYIAHAATGVIASWVLGELVATEEEVAEHLTHLMPRWMHSSSPASAGDPDGTEGKKKQR